MLRPDQGNFGGMLRKRAQTKFPCFAAMLVQEALSGRSSYTLRGGAWPRLCCVVARGPLPSLPCESAPEGGSENLPAVLSYTWLLCFCQISTTWCTTVPGFDPDTCSHSIGMVNTPMVAMAR